jgi:hypothetical protein
MKKDEPIGKLFLDESIDALRSQKRLAERAVVQLKDGQLHVALDENTNTVAIVMKHIAGNLLSRWTDFLTADGEKSWRGRDAEFVDDLSSRKEILAHWEKGWTRLFEALSSLTADDLSKTVTIRGEAHTVLGAIERTVGHIGYHVGQIVMLARHLAKDRWTTLSIPRGPGESEKFNERTWKGERP